MTKARNHPSVKSVSKSVSASPDYQRHVVQAILHHYRDGTPFTVEQCMQDLRYGDYTRWLLPFLVRAGLLENAGDNQFAVIALNPKSKIGNRQSP